MSRNRYFHAGGDVPLLHANIGCVCQIEEIRNSTCESITLVVKGNCTDDVTWQVPDTLVYNVNGSSITFPPKQVPGTWSIMAEVKNPFDGTARDRHNLVLKGTGVSLGPPTSRHVYDVITVTATLTDYCGIYNATYYWMLNGAVFATNKQGSVSLPAYSL